MGTNSKDVGDETEATIILELIAHGYSVSLPFGDNDKNDIVIDDSGRLFRVQCKTTWRTNIGTIRFNPHSQTTKDGEYHETSYVDEIDAFLVRFPQTETLYWVDIDSAAERKMDLRLTDTIDHPSINWAEDFEFTGEIPPSTIIESANASPPRCAVLYGDKLFVRGRPTAHHRPRPFPHRDCPAGQRRNWIWESLNGSLRYGL